MSLRLRDYAFAVRHTHKTRESGKFRRRFVRLFFRHQSGFKLAFLGDYVRYSLTAKQSAVGNFNLRAHSAKYFKHARSRRVYARIQTFYPARQKSESKKIHRLSEISANVYFFALYLSAAKGHARLFFIESNVRAHFFHKNFHVVSRRYFFGDFRRNSARQRAQKQGGFHLRTAYRHNVVDRSYRLALDENRRHGIVFESDRRAHRFERFFNVSHRTLTKPFVSRKFCSYSAARDKSA